MIFDKGYPMGTILNVKAALANVSSGTAYYGAQPSPQQVSAPPPIESLTDAQLQFITAGIAKNLKKVLTGVILEGREGIEAVYEL